MSIVSVLRPQGREVRRRYKSKYYPVPEVFWTSMDEPLERLPPAPEGSTGVDVLLPGQDAVPASSEESLSSTDPSPDPYEQSLWKSERR